MNLSNPAVSSVCELYTILALNLSHPSFSNFLFRGVMTHSITYAQQGQMPGTF